MHPLSLSNLSALRRFCTISPLLKHSLFVFRGTIMAPLNVIAGYGKSSRSSCAMCSEAISVNSLRLGLPSKHSLEFDTIRWHHLQCFPVDSELPSSVDDITGFSALESCDQEAVHKTVFRLDKPTEDVSDGTTEDVKDGKEMKSAEVMIDKLNDHKDGMKENISKRTKFVHTAKTKPVIEFSLSHVKGNYKDAKLLPKWKAFQTIIFLEWDGLHNSTKVAAFDFDGCLANTSVKRIGANAWSLMYKSIPEKLKSLYNDGYKLVIFTNESNIERWKNKRQLAVDSKIGRLNSFIERMKIPFQVFIACGTNSGEMEDPFRKPKPGMWEIMEQHFNSGVSIDMDRSFYVGDAAGRENDHSDADLGFAKAIGLKFYVPEDFF